MGFPLNVTWGKENPNTFLMYKGKTLGGKSSEALAGLFCSIAKDLITIPYL